MPLRRAQGRVSNPLILETSRIKGNEEGGEDGYERWDINLD
jgi:hypothetical protein